MSKENNPDLSMDEIDRKIDAMPELDLRDPKNRKKSTVDIEDIVKSLDLEAKMIAAFNSETENSEQAENNSDSTDPGE